MPYEDPLGGHTPQGSIAVEGDGVLDTALLYKTWRGMGSCRSLDSLDALPTFLWIISDCSSHYYGHLP